MHEALAVACARWGACGAPSAPTWECALHLKHAWEHALCAQVLCNPLCRPPWAHTAMGVSRAHSSVHTLHQLDACFSVRTPRCTSGCMRLGGTLLLGTCLHLGMGCSHLKGACFLVCAPQRLGVCLRHTPLVALLGCTCLRGMHARDATQILDVLAWVVHAIRCMLLGAQAHTPRCAPPPQVQSLVRSLRCRHRALLFKIVLFFQCLHQGAFYFLLKHAF